MSSLAQKKLLIPGVVVLAIIILYAFYSSSNAKTDPAEIKLSTAQTSVESVEASTEVVNNEVEEKSVQSEPETKTVGSATEEKAAEAEVTTKKADDDKDIIFVEGKTNDYIVKFPSELSNEPVVVQFFSFWCPHCYNFEPTMRMWVKQKPDSVKLLRVPVVFGRDDWRLAAKSYYIAEELNLADDFSSLMFKTIHVEKSYPQNEVDIGKIFAKLGVSDKNFVAAAKSFNVDSNLRKAEYLAKKYKVTGVPYFLINFKYEGAEASYASQEALFRLWNYLPALDFE